MKSIKLIMSLVTATALWAVIDSCVREKPVDAVVIKSFEMIPPIAEDIQVKLLEKNIDGANVLLTAKLDSKIIRSNVHSVMVNDEKIILRDDGKKGDENAGDGIYSVALKEDEAELKRDIDFFVQSGIKRLNSGKPILKWVNRSAISINDKFRNQDFLNVDLKRGFRFDPDLFLPIAADPLLKDHSLTITDLGVVEDPGRTFNPCTGVGTINGAWTFGKLMADMANTPVTGISAEDFVKAWLNTFMTSATVNGETVGRDPLFVLTTLIEPWVRKSNPGIPPGPLTVTPINWQTFPLDLKFAPFKLLAIVNRIDLRGNSGYTISNAGEGRFVFGFLNEACLARPFTVIFEYGIPKQSCFSLKAYAQQWYGLRTKTPGTEDYNNALQAITDQFTAAGAGGVTKPNGSSLNQVRSNEFFLNDDSWQLRELNIDAATHKLFLTTVKQTPARKFNSSDFNSGGTTADFTILANYVNTNQAPIIANNYEVPLSFGGGTFLGGKAQTEPNIIWKGTATTGPAFINSDEARHVFSLNTCNSCHAGETRTVFTHVKPVSFGTQTTLSRFLTGDAAEPDGLFKVTDPAGRPTGSPTIRGFNDLERRAVDLEIFIMTSCKKLRIPELIRVLSFKPIRMAH